MLPVGRISKLFGLDGGFSINLYDVFPDNFNIEEPLYVIIDMLAVPLFSEHFERRGKNGAIVRFSDIDNKVRAEEFIGLELLVKGDKKGVKSISEDEGELYFEDLIGYTAIINENGGTRPLIRGTVTAYVDNEMNPLLCVETEGNEIYIPAADEFIESADTDSQTIEFNLPEGLLDLYL